MSLASSRGAIFLIISPLFYYRAQSGLPDWARFPPPKLAADAATVARLGGGEIRPNLATLIALNSQVNPEATLLPRRGSRGSGLSRWGGLASPEDAVDRVRRVSILRSMRNINASIINVTKTQPRSFSPIRSSKPSWADQVEEEGDEGKGTLA